MGPDGRERDQFTERDVEILASNPITLVAADAYIQDIISLYQVMRIGYKPLPILPTGLAQLAMHGAFIEIGKRILSGRITVPEEFKKKYAWIYELEHTAVQHDRKRDQEDRPSTNSKSGGLISTAKPIPPATAARKFWPH